MFTAAETGHKVSKQVFDAAADQLRLEMVELQQALRTADFPVIILFVIGFFSLPLLYATDDVTDADLTIKVIGRQWYWSYEYPDNGDFTFDAFMIPEDEVKPGQPRLLATDENLVLPVGEKIRVLVTSSDVLHAFSMPALGSKVDAVPGRTEQRALLAPLASLEDLMDGSCERGAGRRTTATPTTPRSHKIRCVLKRPSRGPARASQSVFHHC